jgi:hypothetical protein
VATVLALTGVFVLSFSGLVLAQSQVKDAVVTTGLADPDRNLDLLDLAGAPLRSLALRHGRAAPFQVRVTDQDIDLLASDAPFQVQATMNNLYRVTGRDADGNPTVDAGGDAISSGKVTVGYVTSPLGTRDVRTDVDLRFLVGSTTAIGCDDVRSLLGLSTLQLVTDPICSLLGGLVGSTLTVADVVVEPASALTDQLLDDALALADMPMRLSNPDSGAFTAPNCVRGLGAADGRCAGSTGTPRRVLQGTPNATQALLDHLEGLAGRVTTVTGSPEAAATVPEVIAALRAAGGQSAQLADRLEQYAPSDQVKLINGLLDSLVPAGLGLGDLRLSGQYRSLPTLTVDTSQAAGGGEYAGTLTVTLVEGTL